MESRGKMTSNNIPEEFPKKQKEDRICPKATQCRELYHCKHAKPHIVNDACKLACGLNIVSACITIPGIWLDKDFLR